VGILVVWNANTKLALKIPIHIVTNLVVDKVSLRGCALTCPPIFENEDVESRGVVSVVRNPGVSCFVDIRVGLGRVGVCCVRMMADIFLLSPFEWVIHR
jgi:hypothetical protein